jgi:DNA-binding NarL/FixJ family response regulator
MKTENNIENTAGSDCQQRLVRLYRAVTRKIDALESKLSGLNRERRKLDREIREFKGVLQSALDDRKKFKAERAEAGRLRALGCTYKEIAKRMGLSNPTMASNRVKQFNKTNEKCPSTQS